MQTTPVGPTGPLAEPYRRWGECLDGVPRGTGKEDSPNSISRQFQQITFNHGLYTFLIGEEKLAGKNLSSRSEVSLAESYLIAENFWPQQLLRVRRLADAGQITGEKGVHSLPALIKDILDNAGLLTRENIMGAKSTTAAVTQFQTRLLTWGDIVAADFTTAAVTQIRTGMETEPRGLTAAEIGPFVVEMQRRVKSATRRICAISNKFVAHAATPLSIQSDLPSAQSVDLNGFWECVCTLAKVGRSIERYILGSPIPLTAFQTNIGLTFVPADDESRLNRHLEAQRCEVGSWRAWNIDEIVPTANPAE